MTKSHLKRINTPKTWNISRKQAVFIARPRPSGHPLAEVLPLAVILRDVLNVGATAREIRVLLNAGEVMVEGKTRKDPRHPVGLLDEVFFPMTQERYRVAIDAKGRLAVLKAKAGEHKVRRIKAKHKSKGRMQVTFHDGTLLIAEEGTPLRVGDSAILDGKVLKEHFPLECGAYILLTGGSHRGDQGVVEQVHEGNIVYKSMKGIIRKTPKKNAFVLGKGKSALAIT